MQQSVTARLIQSLFAHFQAFNVLMRQPLCSDRPRAVEQREGTMLRGERLRESASFSRNVTSFSEPLAMKYLLGKQTMGAPS